MKMVEKMVLDEMKEVDEYVGFEDGDYIVVVRLDGLLVHFVFTRRCLYLGMVNCVHFRFVVFIKTLFIIGVFYKLSSIVNKFETSIPVPSL